MTLPKNAKRVFKGEIFEVYQWKQKMFDGSLHTFERLKRADTVCIIATQKDKILIARELQPDWKGHKMTLLGGRIDPGETPLAAAKRELLEETGCTAARWEFLWTVRPQGKIEWSTHYYIAKGCTRVASQRLDTGEKITVVPLSFAAFLKTATAESFRDQSLALRLLRMERAKTLREFQKKIFS